MSTITTGYRLDTNSHIPSSSNSRVSLDRVVMIGFPSVSIANNQTTQLDPISSNQQHSQVKSKNLSPVFSNPNEKVSHLCQFCRNSFSSLVWFPVGSRLYSTKKKNLTKMWAHARYTVRSLNNGDIVHKVFFHHITQCIIRNQLVP